jgi:hypothetical protein
MNTIIPPTSPTRYLSGMAALNIPSDSGTGDWHMIETFFKPTKVMARLFVAGVGCADDTTPLLYDLGVFECSDVLDRHNIPHTSGPVFAASHARAIADMVLVVTLEDGNPAFIDLDDWMPEREDKNKVFELLDIATSKMGPHEKERVSRWIAANSN